MFSTGFWGLPNGFVPVISRIMELGGVDGLHFTADIAQRASVTTMAEISLGVIGFAIACNDTLEAAQVPDVPMHIPLVADGLPVNIKSTSTRWH